MPSPTIDFRAIRSHSGSQHGGFEELVCQLAALDTTDGMPFHRKGVGADAGLECYRVEPDGSETGWQAKYFFDLESGEVAQIKKSFDNAIGKHPALGRFIVCLPFDLSDGRVGRRKSQRDRWNAWVKARVASIAPRVVKIELWGRFQLTERLSRSDPLHVGRRTYWFDLPHFGTHWLKDQFEIARAALGRRYSPELNVELPIRQALAAFARDPDLARRINTWADDLDESRHRALREIGGALGTADALEVSSLSEQVAKISAEIRATPLGPTDLLPIDKWRSLVTLAIATLDRIRSALWELRRQSTERQDKARNALYFAEQLREALDRTAEEVDDPGIRLANARCLLLTGEAGVGKSHLLADVVEHHISLGFPAILMLGGAFSDADPWKQVADQLGLTNTQPDAILGALDSAAESSNTRALLMVDALNERNGIAVWSDRLPTFLAVAKRFSHVAILVSCRTTFVPYIVRDLDDGTLPRLKHPGFAGKAAEAARRYLDQRGIVRMAAPHFAPEFENPLFLRTCCDMLERCGMRELPRGLAGVSSVFDFYFSAVVESLNKRMGLAPKLNRIDVALAALTEAMVVAGTGYLSIDAANAILEDVHPSSGLAAQNLFVQLESEGVITIEPTEDDGKISESVRFTFERISDHRIAQRLLDSHVGSGDPKIAFVPGQPLARYVGGTEGRHFAGIAEALAVQMPERYGVELIDVVQDKYARWNLVHGFEVSLLWRRQDVFTERTLQLVEEWADTLGGDAVLETLIAVATEPSNRFNSNYLDDWLRKLTMPERDLEWSIRCTQMADGAEGPIKTLIDWVLANGLDEIEPERARLAAIALVWLTSLSHRWVRDMATKALAMLLVDRRELAVDLLAHFANIDDSYVLDRLLASAYAAAMRRWNVVGLAELACAASTAVFARSPLPNHALIRDHARGIIELAASRGVLPSDVSLDRARPPYPRGAPLEAIGKRRLKGYVQDYGGNSFHDDICSSAVDDGDFARYEIDPLAGYFLRLPREENGQSMGEVFEKWYANAIGPHPELVAAFERVVDSAKRVYLKSRAFELDRRNYEDELVAERAAEKQREDAISDFECMLDKRGIEEFRIRAAGYVRGRMWQERAPAWHPTYAGIGARRWVAWRAHELGWISERFAAFDRQVASHGRMEHRVERIGKKYQWIAFHELTGRLSDIALIDARSRDEPDLYHGPWQVGTREMDPTLLVTSTKQRSPDLHLPTWWSPHVSHWRDDPPAARIVWMEDRARDVPDPVREINIVDTHGRRWLVLDKTIGRNHLVLVDGQRVIHRMTWYKVKSMLVSRHDVRRLERMLADSDRTRDHLPEVEMPWKGYLGEYPWHPAFADVVGSWEIGESDRVQVHATVANWYVERSGHDYSIEDSFNLTIPAPTIVRGLQLRLAEGRSLAYATPDGTVLFKDPSAEEPGPSAAVVDYDALRKFLAAEGLEIVWVFTGEKSAHGGRPHGNAWGGMLEYWGIYRFDGADIKGTLNFELKAARSDQLTELMAFA